MWVQSLRLQNLQTFNNSHTLTIKECLKSNVGYKKLWNLFFKRYSSL